MYLRGTAAPSHQLTMPPISDQFYDDDDSNEDHEDDNEDDEDNVGGAPDSYSSEGETRDKEFKVRVFLPHVHISRNTHTLPANAT